jgi:hypothetical protein
MIKRPWNLYWVECPSPDENCFVVARSARSAAKFEEDNTGFNPRDCTATLVRAVPAKFGNTVLPKGTTEVADASKDESNSPQCWPGYAREWLLAELGAKFKFQEDAYVILIQGRSYRTPGLMEGLLGKKPRMIRSTIDLIKRVDQLSLGIWLYRGQRIST